MPSNSNDKYFLQWSGYEKTVSKSFGFLRSDSDLCDVTLISEDFLSIMAHKVVLSASSKFFKNLLKKTAGNPNPFLFLGGVNSRNLNYCLDYMYNGQVEIPHDHLDEVLSQAQKLQIEGIAFDTNTQVNVIKPPGPMLLSDIKNEVVEEASDTNGQSQVHNDMEEMRDSAEYDSKTSISEENSNSGWGNIWRRIKMPEVVQEKSKINLNEAPETANIDPIVVRESSNNKSNVVLKKSNIDLSHAVTETSNSEHPLNMEKEDNLIRNIDEETEIIDREQYCKKDVNTTVIETVGVENENRSSVVDIVDKEDDSHIDDLLKNLEDDDIYQLEITSEEQIDRSVNDTELLKNLEDEEYDQLVFMDSQDKKESDTSSSEYVGLVEKLFMNTDKLLETDKIIHKGSTVKQSKDLSSTIQELTDMKDGVYICKLCDYFSTYKQSLKIHIEFRHLEGLEYECNICSQVLATDHALTKHKIKMHNNGDGNEPQSKKRRISKGGLESDPDTLCETLVETTTTNEKDKLEQNISSNHAKKDVTQTLETTTNENLNDSKTQSCEFGQNISIDLTREDETQKLKYNIDRTPVSDKIKVSSQEDADLKTVELTQKVGELYKCLHCGATMKNNIKTHIGLHFDGLRFDCKYCDKVFPNKRSLYSHNIQHKSR